jgi:hypothetical protein
VTFDDHPFATVFSATEHIRKPLLEFSDGHGGHRPFWHLASLDNCYPNGGWPNIGR